VWVDCASYFGLWPCVVAPSMFIFDSAVWVDLDYKF